MLGGKHAPLEAPEKAAECRMTRGRRVQERSDAGLLDIDQIPHVALQLVYDRLHIIARA